MLNKARGNCKKGGVLSAGHCVRPICWGRGEWLCSVLVANNVWHGKCGEHPSLFPPWLPQPPPPPPHPLPYPTLSSYQGCLAEHLGYYSGAPLIVALLGHLELSARPVYHHLWPSCPARLQSEPSLREYRDHPVIESTPFFYFLFWGVGGDFYVFDTIYGDVLFSGLCACVRRVQTYFESGHKSIRLSH